VSRADAIRKWKPELKSFGFVFQDGMFVYGHREDGHLDLVVAVQKDTGAELYKINVSIVFRNPLLECPQWEGIVHANVRAGGILLHDERSSWWPRDALPDALRALKQYVVDWYRRVGRTDYLAEVAETAIRDKADVIDVIELMDKSATALPWAPDTPRRLGSSFFYRAAVLHYFNGDRERAIQRTKDWLAVVPAHDSAESAKAQAQLNALTRPN
jgi:hypothetical protein